jgi:acetyl-CoA C-acetyltransferase
VRYGSAEFLDHMAYDGLTNPYDGKAMGVFGDAACAKYGYDRATVDAFAAESARRAQEAQASGAFAAEITPVTVKTRKGEVVVDQDEEPGKIDAAKIPTLRPAFGKEGVLTAASSSKISDGAAALVVMSSDAAAVQNVLTKAGWKVEDVDLFEINEAFACVAMAPMSDLGIAQNKLNVNGGALALGHPIGCSGARLLVTLIHALKARGAKRGVASLCIGGGEATAVAIELA